MNEKKRSDENRENCRRKCQKMRNARVARPILFVSFFSRARRFVSRLSLSSFRASARSHRAKATRTPPPRPGLPFLSSPFPRPLLAPRSASLLRRASLPNSTSTQSSPLPPLSRASGRAHDGPSNRRNCPRGIAPWQLAPPFPPNALLRRESPAGRPALAPPCVSYGPKARAHPRAPCASSSRAAALPKAPPRIGPPNRHAPRRPCPPPRPLLPSRRRRIPRAARRRAHEFVPFWRLGARHLPRPPRSLRSRSARAARAGTGGGPSSACPSFPPPRLATSGLLRRGPPSSKARTGRRLRVETRLWLPVRRPSAPRGAASRPPPALWAPGPSEAARPRRNAPRRARCLGAVPAIARPNRRVRRGRGGFGWPPRDRSRPKTDALAEICGGERARQGEKGKPPAGAGGGGPGVPRGVRLGRGARHSAPGASARRSRSRSRAAHAASRRVPAAATARAATDSRSVYPCARSTAAGSARDCRDPSGQRADGRATAADPPLAPLLLHLPPPAPPPSSPSPPARGRCSPRPPTGPAATGAGPARDGAPVAVVV